MKPIIKTLEITVPVGPEDIAKSFCNMDSEEQAMFFSLIAEEVKRWESPFCFQLDMIGRSKYLTTEGRYIMKEIGQYSEELI